MAVLRRDDIPTIEWPGRIDLPGGAADPGETPERCVLREVAEETGLHLGADRFDWTRPFQDPRGVAWFFAGALTAAEAGALRLGDEGQAIWMMEIDAYLAATDAIPHHQERVRLWSDGAAD